MFQIKYQMSVLEKLQNSMWKAVDLTFVPAKVEQKEIELTDEQKMAELEQALMDIKSEINEAAAVDDEEALNIARKKALHGKEISVIMYITGTLHGMGFSIILFHTTTTQRPCLARAFLRTNTA